MAIFDNSTTARLVEQCQHLNISLTPFYREGLHALTQVMRIILIFSTLLHYSFASSPVYYKKSVSARPQKPGKHSFAVGLS